MRTQCDTWKRGTPDQGRCNYLVGEDVRCGAEWGNAIHDPLTSDAHPYDPIPPIPEDGIPVYRAPSAPHQRRRTP